MNHITTQVVLMSEPSGCVTLSDKVGFSFLTVSVSSITVSFVFCFDSSTLSSNLLSVYPYWFTISFKLPNISCILPMLRVTFVIYSVLSVMWFWKAFSFLWSFDSYYSYIKSLSFCLAASTSSIHSFTFISTPASISESESSSSSFSESVLLSLSKFYNSYWASLSFLDPFVIPSFLNSFACFFIITRNSLSCWISILPSYSTLLTFFWRMFSNLIFSLSWPICLMFIVIWSTNFICSWNISLTPCLMALCLSSLLSALDILYYFYLLDIFVLCTYSLVYFSLSALLSFDILAKPISYYFIFALVLSMSFIFMHTLSIITWVPIVVHESLLSTLGLKLPR